MIHLFLFFFLKEWSNFFFSRKHQYTATYDSCTCCIIEPHVVKDGKSGQVIDLILQQNFSISAMGLFYLTRSQAEEFLEVYKGVVPDFSERVTQVRLDYLYIEHLN